MAIKNQHNGVIPGTLHLVEVAGEPVTTSNQKIKNGIHLIPLPSDDPEDPLNWTPNRKRLVMLMTIIWSFGICTYAFPFSVLTDITVDTGISIADLVQANGLLTLFCGWGCLIWQPIALTYGRRGVYLLSILLMVPITFWTAFTQSKGEWYATRVLLGFAMASVETLPEVTIPDIYFAHERGAWISVYVFSIFAGSYLCPLIGGWFAIAFGWRNAILFSGAITAATFLILFFFMEETMYIRKTMEGLEEEQVEVSSPGNASRQILDAPIGDNEEGKTTGYATTTPVDTKRTYLQKLMPFRMIPGRPTNVQMFRNMYMPVLILFQFPIVAWAGLLYGINMMWFVTINGTASVILSAEPYIFSTGLVGTMYIGPIIGTFFGCWWAGSITDRFTLYLARRNGGIREPEQRLWTLTLGAILSCAGLIMWGVGAQHGVHWIVLIIGLALLTFAVVVGSSASLSYNVDCFKDISGESTTSVILVRNTMAFAISYGITPWYTNMGLQNCFILAGFLSVAVNMSFLLMSWKGKSLRKWSAPLYWKYAEESFHHE